MEIIVGLALACGLLYFWLAGHWFGRVLMFLLLAVAIGCIGIAGTSQIQFEHADKTPTWVEAVGAPECVGKTDPFCNALRPSPQDKAIAALPTRAPSLTLQIIGGVGGVVLAWFVSGIPIYCQQGKKRSAIRRGFQMLHPDWTPEQIEAEVNLHRH